MCDDFGIFVDGYKQKKNFLGLRPGLGVGFRVQGQVFWSLKCFFASDAGWIFACRRHAEQVERGGVGTGDATAAGGGLAAGESGQTPSAKALGVGALEREIIECLRQDVAWAEEECEFLRKMIRNKKGGGEAGGAGRGQEAGGLGKEGKGEEGGGLTVDEWRTVVAHGRDANGFGQFGIKRPLFSAVRSTFFKA